MCKTIDESKARPDVGCTELLAEMEEGIPLMKKNMWYFFPKKYHETIRVHLVDTGRFESRELPNGTFQFRLAERRLDRQAEAGERG